MVREPVLAEADLEHAAAGRLDRTEVLAGLQAAGLVDRRGGRRPAGRSSVEDAWLAGLADGLIAEGTDHALRVQLERAERGDLAHIGRPLAELPALPGGIDLGALYDLAEMLTEQGVA